MKDAWILVIVAACSIGFVGMSAFESHATGKPLWKCLTSYECSLALGRS